MKICIYSFILEIKFRVNRLIKQIGKKMKSFLDLMRLL